MKGLVFVLAVQLLLLSSAAAFSYRVWLDKAFCSSLIDRFSVRVLRIYRALGLILVIGLTVNILFVCKDIIYSP